MEQALCDLNAVMPRLDTNPADRLAVVIPGRAEGASPEPITTVLATWHGRRHTATAGAMGSGLLAALGPGMTS